MRSSSRLGARRCLFRFSEGAPGVISFDSFRAQKVEVSQHDGDLKTRLDLMDGMS